MGYLLRVFDKPGIIFHRIMEIFWKKIWNFFFQETYITKLYQKLKSGTKSQGLRPGQILRSQAICPE